MPIADETTRAFRDRPLGKALIVLFVLVVALFVARSCGQTETEVSQDEAVEIARTEVSFNPNDVKIRLLKRGLRQRELWLVGLGVKRADGSFEHAANIIVDADSGAVVQVTTVIGGGS